MRLVRTVSWILTFVAIGAAAAAWFTPRISADRAGEVAVEALEEVGIDDATVRGTPRAGTYTPSTTVASGSTDDAGGERAPTTTGGQNGGGSQQSTTTATSDKTESAAIDVWIVKVASRNHVIEMRVHKSDGQLVYVDDLIGQNQDRRLLDNDQWKVVERYKSGGFSPWVRRNVIGSVASALIVVVGFLLAKRSDLFQGPQDPQDLADANRDSA